MKIVLTGAAGNITRPLSETLLANGHDVTIIGRNAENLEPLTSRGAKAAIGSIEDISFLTETFKGADAVYTMVPPNFGAADWKAYIGGIGTGYAEAIRQSGVKHVVNLSSIGADQPDGTGPVTGLHRVEQALNKLSDVAVLHLRAGFFYNNYFGNIGMIKAGGIIGANYGEASVEIPLVDPQDIAAAIASAIQSLDFSGHSVRYIVSDVRSNGDVARVLGAAIGNDALPWVAFTDEQAFDGLQQAGLPEEIAKNYAEMGAAIRDGKMQQHFTENNNKATGKRKLEDFAQVFAQVYAAN
jgi:uncharacterized protein YbjT (DUF2867 family)